MTEVAAGSEDATVTPQAQQPPPPAIELERAVGYNAGYGNCCADKAGDRYYYLSGGCVVQGSLTDPTQQDFMRGTEDEAGLMCVGDGTIVAAQTAGTNPDVVVWDVSAAQRRLRFRVTEHDHGVAAIALSADGRLLLTVGGGEDRRAVAWDAATGGMVAVTQLPAAPGDDGATAACCAWGRVEDAKRRATDAYQFAVPYGGAVFRCSLNPYEGGAGGGGCGGLTPLRTSTANIVRRWTSAVFSVHGDLLFLGSETGDVCVLGTRDGVCLAATRVFDSAVRFLAVEGGTGPGSGPPSTTTASSSDPAPFQYSQFGEHAVRSTTLRAGSAAGDLHTLHLSDHRSAKLATTLRHRLPGGVNSISPFPGGVVAGTCAGGVFRVDDCAGAAAGSADLAVTRLVSAPLGAVTALAYHPTRSDTFASGSADGLFRMWDLSTYFELCSGGVGSGDGRRVRGTLPAAGHLREGAVRGGGEQGGALLCIAHVGQTDTVVTGWGDGGVRCFDALDGELHWEVREAHQGAVTAVVVASNLSFFATAGERGEVKVWSLRSRTLVRELAEHRGPVTGLQLFNDDAHLLSSSHDRSILTWDLATGQRAATNLLQMGQVHAVHLCRNQQNFLSTGSDRRVSLWDTRQHEPVRQAAVASAYRDVTATALSGAHSDRFFATGGTDQVVTLWDMHKFAPVQTGVAHTATVNKLAFAPDDRQLLSCSNDRSIMVWNLYS